MAVYRFTAEGAALAADIPYGGGIGPYVVTQRSGAYFSVPDFMANQHRVETEADAAAFISRLSAFAMVLDQESERIAADAALGVMLPSFLMDMVNAGGLVKVLKQRMADKALCKTD